jgi:hypothetical protein
MYVEGACDRKESKIWQDTPSTQACCVCDTLRPLVSHCMADAASLCDTLGPSGSPPRNRLALGCLDRPAMCLMHLGPWYNQVGKPPDAAGGSLVCVVNFGLRSACDTKERNWQQHTIHLLSMSQARLCVCVVLIKDWSLVVD